MAWNDALCNIFPKSNLAISSFLTTANKLPCLGKLESETCLATQSSTIFCPPKSGHIVKTPWESIARTHPPRSTRDNPFPLYHSSTERKFLHQVFYISRNKAIYYRLHISVTRISNMSIANRLQMLPTYILTFTFAIGLHLCACTFWYTMLKIINIESARECVNSITLR